MLEIDWFNIEEMCYAQEVLQKAYAAFTYMRKGLQQILEDELKIFRVLLREFRHKESSI